MNDAPESSGQRPRFSVVMPVYNKRPHLARSIGSVLAQSLTDFELLVVDDASTDGSLDEARQFEDPRIRVLASGYSVPAGPGPTRNRGWRAARAVWIAFLDADDEWAPEHLAEIERLIALVPEAAIVGTCWRISGDERLEKILEVQRSRHLLPAISGEEEIDRLGLKDFLRYSLKGSAPFCSSSVALRRETLLHAGGFPEGRTFSGEDVDTWLRAIAFGRVAGRSRKVTAVYHRDSQHMVTRNSRATAEYEYSTIGGLLETDLDRESKRLLKKLANLLLLRAALSNIWRFGEKNYSIIKNIYLDEINTIDILKIIIFFMPARFTGLLYKLYITKRAL